MAVLVCVLCALGWVLARVRGRGDVGRGVDKWGFGHAWRRRDDVDIVCTTVSSLGGLVRLRR